MKSSHHLPPERAIFAPPNQINGSYMDIPGAAYAFDYPSTPLGREQSAAPPFQGIEFQPSKLCPRNFIIFDQTDFQSRVMFHPAIAPKFAPAGIQTQPAYVDNSFHAVNEDKEVSSSPNQEDSDEINALMSLDDDDDDDNDGDCEEYDEDEMSTARTNGNYGCRSPDSCSNYGPPKLKRKSSGVSSLVPKSCGSRSSSSCSSGTKKQKMKKMVKALRGIVPGGQRMSTATLLDEAVNYLKSLKVEAQKLGDVKN